MVTAGADGGPADVLSPEEFAAAYNRLKSADRSRLMKEKIVYSFGNVISNEDLLHEAFIRTLAGERRCPRDLDIIVYLQQTMRSLASEQARVWQRTHQTPLREDGEASGKIAEHVRDHRPAEDHIIKEQRQKIIRERVAMIFERFADDPTARQFLTLILKGKRGAELQKELNLDDVAYATLRRKVKRRCEKLIGNITDDL
jgi:DNA-directed RNA polymerase specialized sigma24 family protein